MALSENEEGILNAAKLIFGDAKPNIRSDHKVLLAALNERINGKITSNALSDICFKWALEFALEDYRIDVLPSEPTAVTEWKYMDRKVKDKLDDRTTRYYELALIGYSRTCSTVLSHNKATLEHMEDIVEHFVNTGDKEREAKARAKLEDLRSKSAAIL